MTPLFDKEAYLNLSIDEAFERRPVIPAADYPALIQSVDVRKWQAKDKYYDSGPRAGQLKEGIAYDLKLEVEVPLDVRERLGFKPDFKLMITDSLMADLNSSGGLDTTPGANRQMRAYREALDMNKPGVPFRPAEMAGRRVLLRVKHEAWPEGSDNLVEKPNGVSRL